MENTQPVYRDSTCIALDYCRSVAAIKNLKRFTCKKCKGPISTMPVLEPAEHAQNSGSGKPIKGPPRKWKRDPERIKELIEVYRSWTGSREQLALHFGITQDALRHAIFKHVPDEIKKARRGPYKVSKRVEMRAKYLTEATT